MNIKKLLLYYLVPIVLIMLYLAAEYGAPRNFDWNPSYNGSSREPLGCNVLYSFLPDLFPDHQIETSNNDLYSFVRTHNETEENLIIITEELDADKQASQKIANWVRDGNHLFVSSFYFSPEFCEAFSIKYIDFGQPFILTKKPLSSNQLNYFIPNTTDSLQSPGPWKPSMIIPDTNVTSNNLLMFQLSPSSKPESCCISFSLGEGSVVIHGAPYLFSNYMLHSNEALLMAEYSLSQIPNNPTYWDEYYKPGNQPRQDGGMSVIFNRESIRIAWQLLLALMFLYIIFYGKRTQKPIPVIEPPLNRSVEYISTLGRLYYERRDNRDILLKRYRVLLSVLRKRFSIQLNPDDNGFIDQAMMATGASYAEIEKLVKNWNYLKTNNPDSASAMRINQAIDAFYEKHLPI